MAREQREVYGEELKKQILEEKERLQKSISDRLDHVLNCDYDWDDCFLSQRCEQDGVWACDQKLKILEGDGLMDFPAILDENGKEVHVHSFRNKWGGISMVANGVFASSIPALLKKTGWTRSTIRVPAWVAFRSGGKGLCGVMSGSSQVVRWHTNMVTGEYFGYPEE